MNNETELLTPEELNTLADFEAWLKSKEPAETVGVACSECNCPLSNWLSDRLWFEYASVDYANFNLKNKCVPHSELTHAFAVWLDDAFDGDRKNVTAQKALLVLQDVRKYQAEMIQRGRWR